MPKTKRPPGSGRSDLLEGVGTPSVDPITAPSQAEIFVPHTVFSAVRVGKSRDGNRIHIDILLKQRRQWMPGGPAPSFPASMLESVISGLMQLRDRMAGGR